MSPYCVWCACDILYSTKTLRSATHSGFLSSQLRARYYRVDWDCEGRTAQKMGVFWAGPPGKWAWSGRDCWKGGHDMCGPWVPLLQRLGWRCWQVWCSYQNIICHLEKGDLCVLKMLVERCTVAYAVSEKMRRSTIWFAGHFLYFVFFFPICIPLGWIFFHILSQRHNKKWEKNSPKWGDIRLDRFNWNRHPNFPTLVTTGT